MTMIVPEWDLTDRLKKSLRAAGVGSAQMADYLGVSRDTVGTWTSGRIKPSVAVLRAWAQRTGVEFEWLLGDGEGVRRQGLEPRTRWLMLVAAPPREGYTRALVSAA